MSEDVRYGYAALLRTDDFPEELRLDTTDPALVDWAIAELQRMVPRWQRDLALDWGGEACSLSIGRYEGSQKVRAWFIKGICRQGWEPFAVTGSSLSKVVEYHFRKRL